MPKAKITKNIIRKGEVIMGLTKTQIMWAAVSFGVGILMFTLLRNKINIELLMTLIFFVMAAITLSGVVKIQGVSFVKFIILGFKGVDKRPYNAKGVFDNVQSEKK